MKRKEKEWNRKKEGRRRKKGAGKKITKMMDENLKRKRK